MVIGVLGGMGTYATIRLFQKYAEVFPAKKEWERPRIVIDNRCTMPSRVRAILYDESVDLLLTEMIDSMNCLIKAGCDKLIIACNTSHVLLPKIYSKAPELKSKILNIVETCVDKIIDDDCRMVYLLASEATIESGIFQNALENNNVTCLCPESHEYSLIRACIEAVKQNEFSDEIKEVFLGLVNKYYACILGCTELPILYEMYEEEIKCKKIYDPLLISLSKIKEGIS